MRKCIFLSIVIAFSFKSKAQYYPYYSTNGQVLNTITTAVPFVSITSNASQFGQGEVGVVANDYNYQSAMHSNPALLSRGNKIHGASINYTPWLSNLVPNIKLADAYGFFSVDSNNTIGFKSTYFSLGDVVVTNINGNNSSAVKPYEYLIQLSYSHNFSKNFSIGISPKYIFSDFINKSYAGANYHYGKSIAADLGLHYRYKIYQSEKIKITNNTGLAIQNVGSKMSYNNSGRSDFLPTNLALGSMITTIYTVDNTIKLGLDISYEANKLLVPSPGSTYVNYNNGYYNTAGVFQGMLQSFSDAPGGKQEEWNEVIHKVGTEARIIFNQDIILAARAGYFYESKYKGNRKFATIGAGITCYGLQLSIANILPVERQSSPLANTFSFGISYTSGLKF